MQSLHLHLHLLPDSLHERLLKMRLILLLLLPMCKKCRKWQVRQHRHLLQYQQLLL